MSIAAAQIELTPAPVLVGLLVLWTAAALAVMRAMRIFRAESIQGPPRLGPDESAWVLVVILVGGVGAGIFVAGLVQAVIGFPEQMQELLSGAVLFGLVVLAILLGNLLLREQALRWLGLDAQRIPRGLLIGIAAILLVLPLVYGSSVLVALVLHVVGLEEPAPHPVLQRLGLADDIMLIVLLAVSAVVLAPLGEELVFRGMLQTILRRAFGGERPEPPALPTAFAQQQDQLPGPSAPPPAGPLEYQPVTAIESRPRHSRISAGGSWAAVIVSSVLFTVVHGEVAFFVPLFILSIAMGYVYERTGNLWIPIFMHAAFNGIQMVAFTQLTQPA